MIYKELKSHELEFKFLVENMIYGKAIREIYKLFKHKKINGFAIDEKWKKSKKIKPRWKKKIIPKYGVHYFYGSRIKHRIINDIVLLRKEKFFKVKQKLSDEENCSNNKLSKFIKKRLEFKGKRIPYNKKDVNSIITDLEKVIHRKLFLVGINYRKRLIFYVYNIKTKRAYGLSVDFNKSNSGEIMQQFEIEYRGIYGRVARDPEKYIVADILFLAKTISKFLNKNNRILKPTKLTKFEWLLGKYKN